MESKNDKKSRNTGLIGTVVFHGVVALLLFMAMAWTAPDPPYPKYGEINLGWDDAGSGTEQSLQEPGSEGTETEDTAEPQPEQTIPETTPETDPAEAQEEVVKDDTNPVSVVEKKTEVKEKQPDKPKTETKVEPKEEKKTVNQDAVFNPNPTTETTNKTKQGEKKSQGDETGATGDKGDPKGNVNSDALYSGGNGSGGKGTGSGAGLEISGWNWDKKPSPKIPENETGKVVFEIEVGEDGDITYLQPVERGLSAEAIEICRKEIMKLTFSPTGSNPKAARGRITIVAKVQ